jgi:hypothetical protein
MGARCVVRGHLWVCCCFFDVIFSEALVAGRRHVRRVLGRDALRGWNNFKSLVGHVLSESE